MGRNQIKFLKNLSDRAEIHTTGSPRLSELISGVFGKFWGAKKNVVPKVVFLFVY